MTARGSTSAPSTTSMNTDHPINSDAFHGPRALHSLDRKLTSWRRR
jgi:hypothetical protein